MALGESQILSVLQHVPKGRQSSVWETSLRKVSAYEMFNMCNGIKDADSGKRGGGGKSTKTNSLYLKVGAWVKKEILLMCSSWCFKNGICRHLFLNVYAYLWISAVCAPMQAVCLGYIIIYTCLYLLYFSHQITRCTVNVWSIFELMTTGL